LGAAPAAPQDPRIMVMADRPAQEDLLAAVRALEPQHLARLAGLWAGVEAGMIDPDRQRRRNAARLAVRYFARREDRAVARSRAAAAARAVSEVMAGGGSLPGPVADAAFAVLDALDALAYAEHLTPLAYSELILPWEQLMVELRSARR
jgi:hypothetical protein